MTLSISPELVQARIQLCKEWKDAPSLLREHARSVFMASLEALRLEELRELLRMTDSGKAARDYSFFPTSYEREAILKSFDDDKVGAKWQRALR